MQRFGFDVGKPPLASPPPFAENERRYGLVDEGRAAKVGYDTPELDGRTQPAEPELLPEAKAVAEGKGERTRTGQQVSDEGCHGEARRKLAKGVVEAGGRAEQDSRVRTAFGDWSACPVQAGNQPDRHLGFRRDGIPADRVLKSP
jgi:hypothetical protein